MILYGDSMWWRRVESVVVVTDVVVVSKEVEIVTTVHRYNESGIGNRGLIPVKTSIFAQRTAQGSQASIQTVDRVCVFCFSVEG